MKNSSPHSLPDPIARPSSLPTAIEVVEDRSATARCDRGFLRIRRLLCRNRREDGSHSDVFPVDLVDRENLDAVGVAIWRQGSDGPELLLRACLRPGAYFRKDRVPPVPGERSSLFVQEIVAGVLEAQDLGLEGVRARAAAETLEEAGYRISPDAVLHLGAPFYLVPGVLSEKVYLCAVEVTGLAPEVACGDGSPLEEGGQLTFMPLPRVLEACYRGEVEDAKTELAVGRLAALFQGGAEAFSGWRAPGGGDRALD